MIVMVFVVSSIAISTDLPEEDHHLPGNITLAMLIGVAALPLKPVQALALGPGDLCQLHGTLVDGAPAWPFCSVRSATRDHHHGSDFDLHRPYCSHLRPQECGLSLPPAGSTGL
jgi:hypothetical protein